MARSQKSSATENDTEFKWVWEKDSPLVATVAGDIAALFRAEGVDAPGVLEVNAPPNEASLFAREAIQNSWDAAREWQAICRETKRSVSPFHIDFTFREYTGFEKRKLAYALGLDEHRRQLQQAGAAHQLGLVNAELLDSLHDSEKPLRVLTMAEHGGLGMPGSFLDNESRMMQALLRVGYTLKRTGAGGSYGYGKAGLIAASRIRLILAYSAFSEVSSDPGVSRRLLGVTYWKAHKTKSDSYSGWGRLGKPIERGDLLSAVPFENDEADTVAAECGLDVRDPAKGGGTGTTFLIVDPSIEPADLKAAIERYWWPAMLDSSSGLRIRITDYSGQVTTPTAPKNDPDMAPFVRAFEIASRPQDPISEVEGSYSLGKMTPARDSEEFELGQLGVVADPHGWSFPDDSAVSHCTMIALVRGPRMVVNYHTFRKFGLPHVRGVFIAHSDIDDLLRQQEDKAHTKWESTKLDGTHPHAHLVAKEVIAQIRAKTTEFKNRFKPPAPRPGDLNLPILDELSKLMKGNKPKAPKADKRPVVINISRPARAVPDKSGDLVCTAQVEVRVADWVWSKVSVDNVEMEVALSVAFVEDESIGERVPIKAAVSGAKFKSFPARSGKLVYRGRVKQTDSVVFDVTSDPYDPDWTVRFTPAAVIIDPPLGRQPEDEDAL